MHSSAWVALLRHIPAEQQDRFMLVTASGTEIAIQSFLLIEQECVAVKGRLSGTQDAGRVFFIPYSQLDYFGFQQEVKDAEFAALFGGLTLPEAPPPSPLVATNGHAREPAEEDTIPAPPAPPRPEAGNRPLIRSEVLERFRSRPSGPASSPNLPNPRPPQP
jgi:hypothetical protein